MFGPLSQPLSSLSVGCIRLMHSTAIALQAGNLAKAVGTGFLGDGRVAVALASAITNGSAWHFGNEPRVHVDECSTCSCTAIRRDEHGVVRLRLGV
jgi:hypothetical protein